MKLELKHLAPYLPYGLQMKCNAKFVPYAGTRPKIKGASATLTADLLADIEGKLFDPISKFKPILRPLSDLTKEIEHDGEKFIPDLWFNNQSETMYFEEDFLRGITRRGNDYKISQCSYSVLNKLFEWHFDVFGLIEKGLAIDINTLSK